MDTFPGFTIRLRQALPALLLLITASSALAAPHSGPITSDGLNYLGPLIVSLGAGLCLLLVIYMMFSNKPNGVNPPERRTIALLHEGEHPILPDHVRARITSWGGLHDYAGHPAITRRGYDSSDRLLAWEAYNADARYLHHFVIGYFTDGSIQVDRFEKDRGRTFVGRSVYQYDGDGAVQSAQSYDDKQHRVRAVSCRRNQAGRVDELYGYEFDAQGYSNRRLTVVGAEPCRRFLQANFHLYHLCDNTRHLTYKNR